MNPTKTCLNCGRIIEWRKKWERSWDDVRYCSAKCRKNRPTEDEKKLESTILKLLEARALKATICPSEAARIIFAEDEWHGKMELTRNAARRLASQEKIKILQKGHVVDPSSAKGPIRLRLK
ncbi:DUF2256 and DUF3253 domain-containing protein [Akkermansiaceae bacterium]|nr:DUF2256 and DUF3253 domain-containing protein [Akkermansiaceae bacterium]